MSEEENIYLIATHSLSAVPFPFSYKTPNDLPYQEYR
jgi:hypothetical protein